MCISLKFSEKGVNWYAESLFLEYSMKLYVQLMILFVISLIGEGISSFFSFAHTRKYYRFDYFIFSLAVQVVAGTACQHGWEFSPS